MGTKEKANRFDRIREKAHELARVALAAGDEDARVVFQCTQPPVTPEQAKEEVERLRQQTKDTMKSGRTAILWRNWAGY